MADEETIDTEALQAQIDLSMSFMHGLVSSWIKPSAKIARTSDKTVEDELKESLRRPPRLGVGASIPDAGSSNTREAARLKGQLVGKRKRDTDDDPVPPSKHHQSANDDDDDEESRAGAIKKKAVADPFTTKPKKTQPVQSKPPTEICPQTEKRYALTAKEDLHNVSASGIKILQKSNAAASDDPGTELVTTLPSELTASAQKCRVDAPVSPSNPARSALDTPLLNLDGPVADENSEEDEVNGMQSHTPSKKKRKRRKKKKSLQNQAIPMRLPGIL
ncbi:hypothetical protein V5O48_016827 [Marasmius crinis-equi]|uniref:Uncharacterized protein n=1 Tax=Marasmius crinis-equi TaxID=585013 RepID=A0ABR3EQN8_9AGAR